MKAMLLTAILLTACMVAPPAQLSELSLAARDGDAALIRQLAAKGTDLNEPSGKTQWTPMLHAIHKRQHASVAALLDGGADANRAAGHDGVTPLMMAAAYGDDETVRLLLQHGAKADAALDAALTGTPDVDRFTLFACQDSTVRLIRSAAPAAAPSAGARRWARIKGCGSVS
jgi:ankyrin repeat protein